MECRTYNTDHRTNPHRQFHKVKYMILRTFKTRQVENIKPEGVTMAVVFKLGKLNTFF